MMLTSLILLLFYVNLSECRRVIDVFSVQAVPHSKHMGSRRPNFYMPNSDKIERNRDDAWREMTTQPTLKPPLTTEPSLKLCEAINKSPFFGSFVYCCANKLFRKPDNNPANHQPMHFRCCQGAGLFSDSETMECCGKTLYDTTNELCIHDVIVPMATYLAQIMYPPEQRHRFANPDVVQLHNDVPKAVEKIDRHADLERREQAVSNTWDSSIWLNCSGKMIFNPEGRKASLLDCCHQTPYRRDEHYCLNGELVALSFANGQWLPPVVAPDALRPPFDLDFALPATQRSALLSCGSVWYSITFSHLFLNENNNKHNNQRYSCCGHEIYDVFESLCTPENRLRKRKYTEIPPGVELFSHTLIMCGNSNPLSKMSSITYLVDDSLSNERRPDSCCGVQLYAKSRYGCSVNGVYPLTKVPRSLDVRPPRCRDGNMLDVQPKGLASHWQCCGSKGYSTLDSLCCGSTIVSRHSSSLCCDGVLHHAASTSGERYQCCGRNKIDARFYYCHDNQILTLTHARRPKS